MFANISASTWHWNISAPSATTSNWCCNASNAMLHLQMELAINYQRQSSGLYRVLVSSGES